MAEALANPEVSCYNYAQQGLGWTLQRGEERRWAGRKRTPVAAESLVVIKLE